MSYFQNQDINSQSKFDKTVFLKKNKTSSMFCGDCSFFSQEDNILRKNSLWNILNVNNFQILASPIKEINIRGIKTPKAK